MSAEPLVENNIWVTIQLNDDLQHIDKYVGDNRLVIGTDQGHADSATEIYALKTFEKDDRLNIASRERILWDNPKELYSIN